VKRGLAPSVSAWVNDALQLKLDHERRLQSLAEFVSAYESGHGEISSEEIRLATRRARAKAIAVRGRLETKSATIPRRRATR
jgi:hypothetical protein